MTKNVDLTAPLQFLVLHELRKPATGTDLAYAIGDRRGMPLTPGTIYPVLKELKRKKLISYRSDGREKVYSLTKKGKDELKELYKEFSKLFKGLRYKIRHYRK